MKFLTQSTPNNKRDISFIVLLGNDNQQSIPVTVSNQRISNGTENILFSVHMRG